jgi:hypothetical protein
LNILTNIIAAEEDELDAVIQSEHPVEEWSGIERRGIDTGKIVMLHCLLTGDEFDLAVGGYEPVHADEDSVVVLRLADTAVEKLANLEDDVRETIAEELAATEEFEAEAWDFEEVLALVTDLADLARLAESQGQALFVWMHPVKT